MRRACMLNLHRLGKDLSCTYHAGSVQTGADGAIISAGAWPEHTQSEAVEAKPQWRGHAVTAHQPGKPL